MKYIVRYRIIFLYGAALALLLFLLRWLELRFIVISHAFEIYVGAIAVIFTIFGIWLSLKLNRPKTIVIEKEIPARDIFEINEKEIIRLGLSRRELDVLELMAEGLSNQEIAARLFVSLNTVKTHSYRLFEKMEVKRRTQAVEMAKRLNIIK